MRKTINFHIILIFNVKTIILVNHALKFIEMQLWRKRGKFHFEQTVNLPRRAG